MERFSSHSSWARTAEGSPKNKPISSPWLFALFRVSFLNDVWSRIHIHLQEEYRLREKSSRIILTAGGVEVARDNRNRCGFSQKSGLSLAPFSKPLWLSREPGKAESPKSPEHNRSLFIRLIVLRSDMFLAWGAERMTVESRQPSGRLCCYLCSPETDQKCPLICARPLSDTHLPFRWNQRSTPQTRRSVARLCTQTILIQAWFSCQASKCPSGCLQQCKTRFTCIWKKKGAPSFAEHSSMNRFASARIKEPLFRLHLKS